MIVTPNGKLTGFVALERPSTKFNENGVYSCNVAFTGAAAKEMMAQIDSLMADSLKNGKNVKKAAPAPYTIVDKTLIVKFKQNAKITSRSGEVFEMGIKIYDASNKIVDEPLYMGEGTTVRIAFVPYMWAVSSLGCGVTLQPQKVQVINLVKREGGGSDSPFDVVEGFTPAAKNSNPFEAADAGKSDDDSGSDF